ncbi:MAG: hypothetical protein Q7R65_02820 [bacterium]|nr:hypothetical protein [bacterium]
MRNFQEGKILTIILLIIVVLFLVASYFYVTGGQSFGINSTPAKESRIVDEAVSQKDYKVCNKLPVEIFFSISSPRANCYKEVSAQTADIEICRIGIKQNLDLTEWGCYLEMAEDAKDVSVCASVPSGLLTSCYIGVALNTKNPTVCENIKDNDQKINSCLVNMPDASPDLCERIIAADEKENCQHFFKYIKTYPK